uniref:Uncharacterized protein n=1 Tax=Physcomitrium patens TaxID=3218 RepID=A0A2K1K654_PHYPA|nr:hypothetical protein PHYPA_011155 [Physcomitrium patens]
MERTKTLKRTLSMCFQLNGFLWPESSQKK